MRISLLYFLAFIMLLFTTIGTATAEEPVQDDFEYNAEKFADVRILRYKIPDFAALTSQQKELLYYLSQAGMYGRDIFYDQNYKHNLTIRRSLEEVVKHYEGDRNSDMFKKFMVYTKRQWFANGIHHHYGGEKFQPEFTFWDFAYLVYGSPKGTFPTLENEPLYRFLQRLRPIIFDPTVDPIRNNQDPNVDIVKNSAVNFYEGVTAEEVKAFYEKLRADNPSDRPLEYGLNSKLIKDENGVIREVTYKVGGMYSEALKKVVFWLKKAKTVAENDKQAKTIQTLIEYFETGDLQKFIEYDIAWLQDKESSIDFILGFIEKYTDPMGMRGAFESVIQVKDPQATKRIKKLADAAQWFEDNSPIMDEHKKAEVSGILAWAINVVSESGDSSPATPIGINLPNLNWIRAIYGSKSVNLSNIVAAYNKAGGSSLDEFAYSQEEIDRIRLYGELSGHLHTDIHEVLGHASGQLNPGVEPPAVTLKQYSHSLEEARADLVALYYIIDPKLIELGLVSTLDVGKAKYDSYVRNGAMQQLRRVKPGKTIQQAHMRMRQMNVMWAYEKGKGLVKRSRVGEDGKAISYFVDVIEKVKKDGKTYFVINDYQKLRELWGQLLKEVQRIKSEGDFETGKALIETYGVQVDQELHKEVLERYEKLNLAPFGGFINPVLVPVYDNDGKITDVKVEYPTDFTQQMLDYAERFSVLPNYN